MPTEKKVLYLHTSKDIRCPKCNRILVKVSEDTTGTLNFKCERCKDSVAVLIRGSSVIERQK